MSVTKNGLIFDNATEAREFFRNPTDGNLFAKLDVKHLEIVRLGLNNLLATRQSEFSALCAHWKATHRGAQPFVEADFGIPQIKELLAYLLKKQEA